jgi:hypothetical protein
MNPRRLQSATILSIETAAGITIQTSTPTEEETNIPGTTRGPAGRNPV